MMNLDDISDVGHENETEMSQGEEKEQAIEEEPILEKDLDSGRTAEIETEGIVQEDEAQPENHSGKAAGEGERRTGCCACEDTGRAGAVPDPRGQVGSQTAGSEIERPDRSSAGRSQGLR